MKCNKCGKEIEESWKYCNYCGNKLENEKEEFYEFQDDFTYFLKAREEIEKLNRIFTIYPLYKKGFFGEKYTREIMTPELNKYGVLELDLNYLDIDMFLNNFILELYLHIKTSYDSSKYTDTFFDNLVDINNTKLSNDFLKLHNQILSNFEYLPLPKLDYEESIKELILIYNSYLRKHITYENIFEIYEEEKIADTNIKETKSIKNSYIIQIVIMIILFVIGFVLFSYSDNIYGFILSVLAFIFGARAVWYYIGGKKRTCPKCNKFNSLKDVDSEILNRSVVNETEYYTDNNGKRRSRLITVEIIDANVHMVCTECGYKKTEYRQIKNKI